MEAIASTAGIVYVGSCVALNNNKLSLLWFNILGIIVSVVYIGYALEAKSTPTLLINIFLIFNSTYYIYKEWNK